MYMHAYIAMMPHLANLLHSDSEWGMAHEIWIRTCRISAGIFLHMQNWAGSDTRRAPRRSGWCPGAARSRHDALLPDKRAAHRTSSATRAAAEPGPRLSASVDPCSGVKWLWFALRWLWGLCLPPPCFVSAVELLCFVLKGSAVCSLKGSGFFIYLFYSVFYFSYCF